MPTNDPMKDSYNPPGNRSIDFEEYSFSDFHILILNFLLSLK